MKFNEKEIIFMSNGKGQVEGRLNYKKINLSSYYQPVFKERWFKLIDNCLFYFRLNDTGQISEREPAGVLVIENASIQLEHGNETPFAFSISFIDEPEKRHLFSGMSEANITQWVNKLRCASYEYLRSRLHVLQSKIYLKTGMDPLLMVPRNEGSKKWAPGEPLPLELSHFDSNNDSHTQTQTSVYRSKSSVSVYKKVDLIDKRLVPCVVDPWENHSNPLERSKTTVNVLSQRHNPFNRIEGNSLGLAFQHHRPAPSPPARKKSSTKICNNLPMQQLSDQCVDTNSILNVPPKPPSRKNSPRQTPVPSGLLEGTDSNNLGMTSNENEAKPYVEEDLIQF